MIFDDTYYMLIKLSTIDDALCLSNYYRVNATHLKTWEPLREDGYHDIRAWEKRLKLRETQQKEKQGIYFLAYNKELTEIKAICNLTGITLGVFMACFMGYSVSKSYEGQGIMKKLCCHAIDYAFNDLGLNRVMANYMPGNKRSEKLLEILGFKKEGEAINYLKINGQWEDHILTSLLSTKL
ncbi:MAG: GNAT family N-acetyltransferase [Thiohalomonadales bacterium]